MLLKPLIMSCRAARKALAPLVQGHAVGTSVPISVPEVAAMHMPAMAMSLSATSLAAPQGMYSDHASILAMLDETARLGHVPADALIGRLHACHCHKLAQDRQQLVALEQELEGHLARLDARFPVPQPEPEKPEPVRIRRFGRLSSDLRGNAPSTDTRQ